MNVFDFFKVPIEFNFVQVVDMYFKIHKVFNVEFHNKIKPVLTLINYFIFGFSVVNSRSVSPIVKDVAKKLFGV